MKKLLLLPLIITFFNVNAQTNVSGVIAVSTTWTLTGSPYIVTGNVVTLTGVTLSIEPGVTVRVQSGKFIEIRGILNAIGTVVDSIHFTSDLPSPTIQSWEGIILENGALANINYCTAKYANNFLKNIFITTAYINNSTITNCNFGIYAQSGSCCGAYFKVDSCLFDNNSTAIYAYWDMDLAYCTFTNNFNGLYEASGGSVDNCTFKYNTGTGLQGGNGGIITNNIIMYNNIGLRYNTQNAILTGNEVAYNNVGWALRAGGSQTNIIGNKFCHNTTYNIQHETNSPITIPNNCFCETNTTIIDQKIYDVFDNISLGQISYIPFNTCSISTEVVQSSRFDVDDCNIYPNPTSGPIRISMMESSNTSVIIRNSLGQVVLVDEFRGTQELNISLDAPAGIYFLQFQTDGEIITKKIIKQ